MDTDCVAALARPLTAAGLRSNPSAPQGVRPC